jgi:hypothetical protein
MKSDFMMKKIIFWSCMLAVLSFARSNANIHAIFDHIDYCNYQNPDDDPRYCMIAHMTLEYGQFQAFLIMDIKQIRYNVYVINSSVIDWIKYTPNYIVEKHEKLSLEDAKTIFPYCFDEANYGF